MSALVKTEMWINGKQIAKLLLDTKSMDDWTDFMNVAFSDEAWGCEQELDELWEDLSEEARTNLKRMTTCLL